MKRLGLLFLPTTTLAFCVQHSLQGREEEEEEEEEVVKESR